MGTINIFLKNRKTILIKLDRLLEHENIVGVKIFPGYDPLYPTDKRLKPVYQTCDKHEFPIMIHTGWNSNNSKVAKYNDPKYIIKIAKTFPNLKIVVSHYFWPKLEYCYEITRQFKKIFFDTSGLADEEVVKQTGIQIIRKVLSKTIKDKPDSLMFGTDYAACNIKKTY